VCVSNLEIKQFKQYCSLQKVYWVLHCVEDVKTAYFSEELTAFYFRFEVTERVVSLYLVIWNSQSSIQVKPL